MSETYDGMSEEEGSALLEALLRTAVDGIIMIDRHGLIQLYSPICEQLFGYDVSEVLGQNVNILMPSPYRDEHDAYLSHYRDSGEKRIIGIGREVVGQRKDGSTFPMYLSVGEGALHGEQMFVGIIHDISNRKRVETALREREARLSSILETVPEAIVIIDEEGLIEAFSPAAERLFGYSFDEVLGENVRLLMPSPYRDEHDGYLRRYKETGEKRIIGIGRVVTGRRRDGTTFPMELSVNEVTVSGRKLFTGFVRDLTERQRTERKMQEIQSELLHVSRLSAMGEMASGLAHEINQPLAAIANYVNSAKRILKDSQDADAARSVELIEKAAMQALRAGDIIRRLRSFVEKGEAIRQRENINKVVEEALALATLGQGVDGISVKMKLGSELPSVNIDKIQIQQVLLNLIRNSFEAMEGMSSGEMVVSTQKDGGGWVLVCVADTGPGLAPEVVEKLFQPFITTKKKGMGIGLSICRSIVEAHGGVLSLAAEKERGAVFLMRLPVE